MTVGIPPEIYLTPLQTLLSGIVTLLIGWFGSKLHTAKTKGKKP